MSNVVDRFIKYAKIDTRSDSTTGVTPSTPGQKVLAKELVKELNILGLKNVCLDNNGYVTAVLPANTQKDTPVVGFISHMDTSPDFTGKNVNPKLVKNYNGGNIVLNSEADIILSPDDFPELKNYIGQTLITTDGTTLLGADDKAGIAEIMAALEYLTLHPEILHGSVHVCFTPDEEIGEGADHFNVEKFGANFAYTVDGGGVGEINYENFNAAYAKVTFKGKSVHPGEAKGKMINSMTVANEFISLLPSGEVPEKTEGYEGFFHLISMEGNVESSALQYIIRDFDSKNFDSRKKLFEKICCDLGTRYGENNIVLEMKDQYYNMREKIEPVKHVVDVACKAMELLGVTPKINPIRGGTDGSRLSYMGLPAPNIFTGGHNFHGRFEYIPVSSMEKAVKVIVKIIELVAKH